MSTKSIKRLRSADVPAWPDRIAVTPGARLSVARAPAHSVVRLRVIGGTGSTTDRIIDGDVHQLLDLPADAHGISVIAPAPENTFRARRISAVESALRRAQALLTAPDALRSLSTAARLLARGEISELCRRLGFGGSEAEVSRPVARPPRPPREWSAEPPSRLLIVGPRPGPSGAPLCQLELAQGLRERGLAVAVWCPEHGPLSVRYAELSIPVATFPERFESVVDAAGYERFVAAFAERLRQAAPDAVLVNTLGCVYAVDAAHRAGIPCVLNPRENERGFFDDRSASVKARALSCFALADRVVFVSRTTARAWAEFDRGHFAVVPDALGPFGAWPGSVDRATARQSLDYADGDLLVLNVGTISARKGQADLVAAAERLLRAGSAATVSVAIVGDKGGRYADSLRAALSALPGAAQARVRLVPETDRVAPWFAAADAFVLTSREESYPRVTLEAMAHALPCVVAPAGGTPEQLVDGESAVFYAQGDIDALAAALAALAADPARRRALGEAARARLMAISDFPKMLDGYLEQLRLARSEASAARAQA